MFVCFQRGDRELTQEFDNKERCFKWFKSKQLNLRHSLKLLAKEIECMVIRTPITNEIVTVYGEPDEIKWLHLELVKSDSYSY